MTGSDGVPWQLAFERSPVPTALADADGRISTANRALGELVGRRSEELAGLDLLDLAHPDDREAGAEAHRRALATGADTYRLAQRFVHPSGRASPAEVSVALVRDGDGRLLHVISQVDGVTAGPEAAAESDRQVLEAIFETVNVGLLLIGPDGRYERMNRHQVEAMRVPFPDGHDGRAGQPAQAFLPDGRTPMPLEQRPSYRAMRGEEFDDVTFWAGSDGDRAAFAVSARQVRGTDGTARGAVLAYQDVTDLLRALQARDEFVSSVSHELRTPLASVLGYLELAVEHESLPDEVASQLRTVERNARRLHALLTDLLDVAQAGERALPLERRPVDLAALAGEAVLATLPTARAAGLEIQLREPEARASTIVDADALRLRQVLDNLLSNAVKYTPGPGRITVTVAPRSGGVEVAVADTGAGIPADELPHVFERFYRGAAALDHHTPGTGLGLHIVRAIVEAHGGTITASSEPGQGSSFVVRLPGTGGEPAA